MKLDKNYKSQKILNQEHINEINERFNVDYNSLSNSEKISYSVKLAHEKDSNIKLKISNKLKILHKQGIFKKAEDAIKSRVWYTNGINNIYIKNNEIPPEGYYRGRTFNEEMKLKFKNLILCSGTPTGGKYEELLTQCKLLGWQITKETFWNMYIDYILIPINGYKMPKVIGYKNVEHLKQRLSQHGAVFMKTEEAIDLPEQIDNVIKVENTSEYKNFKRDRMVNIENKQLIGDTSLTRLLYLRQLASQYNKNKLHSLLMID